MNASMSAGDWVSLTKPRIVFLLCISGVGAYFAAGGASPLQLLVFTVVLGLVAASASVMNCYYDRRLDQRMERTADRPLPAGRIRPGRALGFGLGLLAVGLLIGSLTLTVSSLGYLILGFGSYVFLYTVWLKRSHWLGVVLGGSAGSFPVLAGWAAVRPLEWSGWLMALFVFAWTPAHAWALEYVFRDQYKRAGIPTYPVVKQNDVLARGLVGSALLTVLAAALLVPWTGPFYNGILIGSTPMFLISYYAFYRSRSNGTAAHAFFSANLYLSFLFVGWAVDGYFDHPSGWMLYLVALAMPPMFLWVWQSRPSLGDAVASLDWDPGEAPRTLEP